MKTRYDRLNYSEAAAKPRIYSRKDPEKNQGAAKTGYRPTATHESRIFGVPGLGSRDPLPLHYYKFHVAVIASVSTTACLVLRSSVTFIPSACFGPFL